MPPLPLLKKLFDRAIDTGMGTGFQYGFLGRGDIPPPNLVHAHQVHSNICAVARDAGTDLGQADAVVTDVRGLWVGVKTADCVPVLFADGQKVAAAHAGWRGALSGILENTIAHFDDPARIKCLIGPAIQRASYEVSMGFEVPFLEEAEEAERFFAAHQNPEKLWFDLPGYCAYRLSRAGVRDVNLSPVDTYTDRRFYSYRFDGKCTGRNYSVIQLIGRG